MMSLLKFAAVLAAISFAISATGLVEYIVGVLPASLQGLMGGLVLGIMISVAQLWIMTRLIGMHV